MQVSMQFLDATNAQVEALTAVGFGNRSSIARVAIDRMFREECRPVSEEELVEMAQEALENWDFDASDDPYPAAKAGLENIIDGTFHHVPSSDFQVRHKANWDGLQKLALNLGLE